ncbi:uncharacterized protein LOC108865201 [Galendromus occidentalis]|uniref:Uncharacterized protein LOC108865201 n=1 Tax=Galendromus occidentalis TaxID=34638 RepID=A0AAJ7L872_9ACAR|nr:uncharacterized protein LOC108865201 [Galendromus occidentalis]
MRGLLWLEKSSARIAYLTVPRTVNVDQTDEAILDCQYDFSRKLNDFIIVKWFFNNEHLPIYSWLPNSQTRIFDPHFENFIDKSYRFSADRYQIYRGIRFSHLHPNLTGFYYCTVSTKEGYFEERKPMTLYRTPHFERFEVQANPHHFNLSCDVDGIMRPGELRIYRIDDTHFESLDTDTTLTPRNDRFQTVRAQVRANYSVPNSRSARSFQFQCTVVYPNTDINITRSHLMTTRNSSSSIYGPPGSFVTSVGYVLLGLLCVFRYRD